MSSGEGARQHEFKGEPHDRTVATYPLKYKCMSAKLFVGNLAWGVREDALRQAFESFGELEDVFVMVDRATGRSKGFGFVTFKDEADAAKAKEGMNGKEIDGRPVNVDFAKPKAE